MLPEMSEQATTGPVIACAGPQWFLAEDQGGALQFVGLQLLFQQAGVEQVFQRLVLPGSAARWATGASHIVAARWWVPCTSLRLAANGLLLALLRDIGAAHLRASSWMATLPRNATDPARGEIFLQRPANRHEARARHWARSLSPPHIWQSLTAYAPQLLAHSEDVQRSRPQQAQKLSRSLHGFAISGFKGTMGQLINPVPANLVLAVDYWQCCHPSPASAKCLHPVCLLRCFSGCFRGRLPRWPDLAPRPPDLPAIYPMRHGRHIPRIWWKLVAVFNY